jgi:hypothetical protein
MIDIHFSNERYSRLLDIDMNPLRISWQTPRTSSWSSKAELKKVKEDMATNCMLTCADVC